MAKVPEDLPDDDDLNESPKDFIYDEKLPSHMTQMEALRKLDKDLKDASAMLKQRQARYLVALYYSLQGFRIRSERRAKMADMQNDRQEPHRVIAWLSYNVDKLEKNLQRALDTFALQWKVGNWLQSICGIGPVISAGFLSHLDVRHTPTVGSWWRFAGLDPTVTWNPKELRPWNAKLKVLCYKAGESFVKVRNNENDTYGKLYFARREKEWENNLKGKCADQAIDIFKTKKFKDPADLPKIEAGQLSVAKYFYSGAFAPEDIAVWRATGGGIAAALPAPRRDGTGTPMLPPGHIHARARRWTVKLFMSHIHHVMYEDYHDAPPPVPFVFKRRPEESDAAYEIRRAEEHVHYMGPPNWPAEYPGKSLKELLTGPLAPSKQKKLDENS